MKKPLLRFWHLIIAFILLGIMSILNDFLPINVRIIIEDLLTWASEIWAFLLLYVIIRNIVWAIKGLITRRSSGEAEKLERQREIERKEIDMVRKSNEILLHLIQDEHREDGDR